MKKNLRIVSAAAAALLAVAPVAATAVSTVSADTTIDLGGATNTDIKNPVDVTPSIVLHGNVTENNQLVAKAALSGSISASFGGQSYTANLEHESKDNQNVSITDASGANVALSHVNAESTYTVTVKNVGFNFGSANAGKTITLHSSNENVKFAVGSEGNSHEIVPSQDGKTAKVTLNQNGTVKGLNVVLSNVTAFNATNTNDVVFYNVASGQPVTSGTAMVLANTQGKLNTKAILPAIQSEYIAIQRVNGLHQIGNGSYTVDDSLAKWDLEASDIKDQLKAQKIDVDANGFFNAPHTFTVKVKATSKVNGKTAELPVTVTVANVAEATEPSVSKMVMHNAYFYDKNYKRVGSDKAATYSSLNLVTENGSLKKFTISGKTMYKVANEDKYVAAGNITGTSRTLKHNAYVYATSKKRVAAKTTYKKGQSVTTYGAAVKLKNGKAYYRVGKTEYVKKANF